MDVQQTVQRLKSQGRNGMACLVQTLAEREEKTGKVTWSLSIPLSSEKSTSFGNAERSVLSVLGDMANGQGLPSADSRVMEAFDWGCQVVARAVEIADTTDLEFVPLSSLKDFKDFCERTTGS